MVFLGIFFVRCFNGCNQSLWYRSSIVIIIKINAFDIDSLILKSQSLVYLQPILFGRIFSDLLKATFPFASDTLTSIRKMVVKSVLSIYVPFK
jgi:hypothetical protein